MGMENNLETMIRFNTKRKWCIQEPNKKLREISLKLSCGLRKMHTGYIMQEMLTRNSTDIRETYIKVQSITLQGTIMKPKTE